MLWFNVKYNYFWAGGNVFLLGNTWFAGVQTFLSLFLAFEIPVWLAHAKVIRMYSLMFATMWNFTFLVFYYKAKNTIKNASEEEFDGVALFEILFIGYNILLHGPIFVVNSTIIIKEIVFEFLQLGNDAIGGEEEYALGLLQFYMFLRNVSFVLNPLNWFDVIYYIIYGYY
jgi:hypothetical protein